MYLIWLVISSFSVYHAYTLDDFDLSTLTRDDDDPYTYVSGSYTVAFNFRKALSSYNGSACETDTDCILHRWETGTTNCKCYGDYSTETYVIFEDGTGLNFTYIYDEEQQRFTIFNLVCSDTETLEEPVRSGLLNYTITWYLPEACPNSHDSSSSSSSSSSLSIGSILLIIIAAVIVIYLVAGVIVSMTCLHKRGLEIIPCFFFWSSLPGLVIDGIHFMFPCLRRASASAYQYEEV